jgi:hypothetical protein
MTDEQIAFSRRAVACRGWRWMPGMKLTAGLRLSESLVPFTFPVDLPDFTDPATVGCLLALVREAWGDAKTCARPDLEDDIWYVVTRSGLAFAATEAEALVAALEAATDGR